MHPPTPTHFHTHSPTPTHKKIPSRHYIGENSIVFPLINNSNVMFESTSKNFVQAQKSHHRHPRRRRFFGAF